MQVAHYLELIDVSAMCANLPSNKSRGRPSAPTKALSKVLGTPQKPVAPEEECPPRESHDDEDDGDFQPTSRRKKAQPAATQLIETQVAQATSKHGRSQGQPASMRLQMQALAGAATQPNQKVLTADC